MNKKKKGTQDSQIDVKEQLARALADYDNLKKRFERERMEIDDRSKVMIVTQLLSVFDMFDRVQKHVNDSGLAMALGELDKLLKDEGFSVIEPKVGEKFDEETMEAVEAIYQEGVEPGKVIGLSLKGWRIGDKILRYAKVVVSRLEDGKERK